MATFGELVETVESFITLGIVVVGTSGVSAEGLVDFRAVDRESFFGLDVVVLVDARVGEDVVADDPTPTGGAS